MAMTYTQLQLLIETSFPNNRLGSITPAKLRTVCQALLDFANARSFTAAVPFASGIVAMATPPQTIVIYNNTLYVCTVSHTTTSIFNPANWEQISPSPEDIYPMQLDFFADELPTEADLGTLSVGDWYLNGGVLTRVRA